MADTLPTLNRTIDDDFVNTWYEIRAEVIDNILDSNIFSMALRDYGCMVPQEGGEYITRTVGYGKKSKQNFAKGTVLEQSETPYDTMARWDWRYFLVDINRTLTDDMKNSGQFKIKDYVARRIEGAIDSLKADLEVDLFRYGTYVASPYNINGLYDICPSSAANTSGAANSDTQASGTSNGNISRANTYWKNWVARDGASASADNFTTKVGVDPSSPYDLNLLPDMRHFFNLITNNQESPNLILCDQDIYEAYEDEASDKSQIVLGSFTRKAIDLGFDAITFKGATMSWSQQLAASKALWMLNMNHIEMVYHPGMWFDATNWKETANQLEKVQYICCMSPGLITAQPRRHGVMVYSS